MTVTAETIPAPTDMPEMSWSRSGAAYAWAEEAALRPDYRSPAQALVHAMVAEIMPRGRYGPTDYRDLAHTILAAVARVPDPHPREIFRYCYGQGVHRGPHLASTIAEAVQARHSKTYSQVVRLAQVAVFRQRTRLQWRQAAGMGWYARAIGISRPALYKAGWEELIADAETEVQTALERGRRLAREELVAAGVMR